MSCGQEFLKSYTFPKVNSLMLKRDLRHLCWSSILDVCDCLKKNLLWDIGDGTLIRIWGDNWIPSVNFPTKPVNDQSFIVQHGKVCDLIVDGRWDIAPVHDLLPQNILDAIVNIPLHNNDLEDELMWTAANNGVYQVKLGYRMEKNHHAKPSIKASPSWRISSDIWKGIWKIGCAPRVKHFIWRILSKSIATHEALYARRRSRNPLCPICGVEMRSAG
ncbi:uncharacterized protein LOC129312814 isoform X1 [Prosopis cineraria]|uniref:uncharacterized protein LOC129312814 isoform X1 n=1 Tax=Prosopis cineraria TaxID=364024 RepID=UPI00240F13A9|nr:uncharacterized protein LOC129312814 isoform X1 [Prosopis cineraria]